MDFKTTVRRYYEFSKPGIVYANVLTALAGCLFAAGLRPKLSVLVGLLSGMALLIAGACASNNCIDRKRDAAMKRTAKRGLVQGSLSLPAGIGYAVVTAAAGIGLLLATQNAVTVILALIAYVDYVVVYAVAKRLTVHGTLVGCISGAIPLVTGYTAVTGRIDVTAWLLFGLMVAWQMAHFFGIALYRLDDYRAAGFPVMPVRYGAKATKPQVVVYMVLFIAVTLALTMRGDVGIIGGVVLNAAGLYWLYQALRSYAAKPATAWGRQVFLQSLIVMLVMVASLSVGSTLF